MLSKHLLLKKGLVVLVVALFCGAISFVTIKPAIAESVCEGDFDTDGDVDGSDLAILAITDILFLTKMQKGKTVETILPRDIMKKQVA